MQSGGAGVTQTEHYLGATPGRVTLQWNMFTIPDRLEVYYRGRLIASTPGAVARLGGVSFDWKPTRGDYSVSVVVVGDRMGTRWVYYISCPR